MNIKKEETEAHIEQPKKEFKSNFKTWIRVVAFILVSVFLPEQVAQAVEYDWLVIWNKPIVGSIAPSYLKNLKNIDTALTIRNILKDVANKPITAIKVSYNLTINLDKPLKMSNQRINEITEWLKGKPCGSIALYDYLNLSGIQADEGDIAIMALTVDILNDIVKPEGSPKVIKNSLYALSQAAKFFKATLYPVKVNTETDLSNLTPFIAHLKNDHYVLVTRISENKVYYTQEHREEFLPKDIFLTKFSGYALTNILSANLEVLTPLESKQILGAMVDDGGGGSYTYSPPPPPPTPIPRGTPGPMATPSPSYGQPYSSGSGYPLATATPGPSSSLPLATATPFVAVPTPTPARVPVPPPSTTEQKGFLIQVQTTGIIPGYSAEQSAAIGANSFNNQSTVSGIRSGNTALCTNGSPFFDSQFSGAVIAKDPLTGQPLYCSAVVDKYLGSQPAQLTIPFNREMPSTVIIRTGDPNPGTIYAPSYQITTSNIYQDTMFTLGANNAAAQYYTVDGNPAVFKGQNVTYNNRQPVFTPTGNQYAIHVVANDTDVIDYKITNPATNKIIYSAFALPHNIEVGGMTAPLVDLTATYHAPNPVNSLTFGFSGNQVTPVKVAPIYQKFGDVETRFVGWAPNVTPVYVPQNIEAGLKVDNWQGSLYTGTYGANGVMSLQTLTAPSQLYYKGQVVDMIQQTPQGSYVRGLTAFEDPTLMSPFNRGRLFEQIQIFGTGGIQKTNQQWAEIGSSMLRTELLNSGWKLGDLSSLAGKDISIFGNSSLGYANTLYVNGNLESLVFNFNSLSSRNIAGQQVQVNIPAGELDPLHIIDRRPDSINGTEIQGSPFSSYSLMNTIVLDKTMFTVGGVSTAFLAPSTTFGEYTLQVDSTRRGYSNFNILRNNQIIYSVDSRPNPLITSDITPDVKAGLHTMDPITHSPTAITFAFSGNATNSAVAVPLNIGNDRLYAWAPALTPLYMQQTRDSYGILRDNNMVISKGVWGDAARKK